MSKKHSPIKTFVFIFVAIALVLATYNLAHYLGPNEASAATPTATTSTTLTGTWHQKGSGLEGSIMTANITNGDIQINIARPDGSGIYWLGTFEGDQDAKGQFAITSLADQDAMNYEVFASQDKSKLFSYQNGELTFPYSVHETSTIIHLTK